MRGELYYQGKCVTEAVQECGIKLVWGDWEWFPGKLHMSIIFALFFWHLELTFYIIQFTGCYTKCWANEISCNITCIFLHLTSLRKRFILTLYLFLEQHGFFTLFMKSHNAKQFESFSVLFKKVVSNFQSKIKPLFSTLTQLLV